MRYTLLLCMVALATGCYQHMPSFDERLDSAEAASFCQRWTELAALNTPEAALEKARIGINPPTTGVLEYATCVTREQLLAAGRQGAEQAVGQLPQNAEAWHVLAADRLKADDTPGASQAACRAAELAPSSADLREECGDYLLAAEQGLQAVEQWKSAFLISTDREQQFALIEKIERTSPQPQTDVSSLAPEIVAQYQEWKRQQQIREQLKQQREMLEEMKD